MNNNEELMTVMKQIEEDGRLQREYARKQYQMSKIGAYCAIAALVVVIISVLVVVPKIFNSFNQVNTILKDVEGVSKTLNEELPVMIESLNAMVGNENSGLIEAINNFNKFDVSSLNEAVENLKAAVEPLARLFGR